MLRVNDYLKFFITDKSCIKEGKMRKILSVIALNFIFVSALFPAYPLIIPQKDGIYTDLSRAASLGVIKSVDAEYFGKNAITSREAAFYIIEAKNWLNAGKEKELSDAEAREARAIIAKYEKVLAEEIKIAVEAETQRTEEAKSAYEGLDEELSWLEEEYAKTRFTDATPFKVTGVIAGRWQQLMTSGITNLNVFAMSGTRLDLYTEGTLTEKIKFNTTLFFEMPSNDPSYGIADTISSQTHLFFGDTKSVGLDIYTITLDVYGLRLTTGFFWEDITSFIASQGLTERTGIFDRDIYAGETATRANYETIFRTFSQSKDDRWSKHQWNGFELYKDGLFGKDIFKAMAGKTTHEKDYVYEYAARYTHFRNFPRVRQAEWSLNFYNMSNDEAEINSFPAFEPESLKKSITIAGADMKAALFSLFKVKAEFERSWYRGSSEVGIGSVVPSFYQDGNAIMCQITPQFFPKQLQMAFKYTRIDPGYTAPASAVEDMNMRKINAYDPSKVDVNPITFCGDPTSYYNNMNKAEASAYIGIPFGMLMVNYGVSQQIRATGNVIRASHWLAGDQWWNMFYSNYGWPVAGAHDSFINYNINRYGFDSSLTDARAQTMLSAGTGGLATDFHKTSREYIISEAVQGLSHKTLSNIMFVLRYELNKPIRLASPLLLELYGELITLSNETNLLVEYNPARLMSQNLFSACLVYNVFNKLSFLGYFAYERWGANEARPVKLDYFDTAYGFGADYDLAGRAFLYLRLKRFFHDDIPVPANDFNGWQLWLELKSFF